MSAFELVAILVTLTALLGWVNQRWIGVVPVVGVTLGGLVFSLALLGIGKLELLGIRASFANDVLSRLDFNELLLNGLLGAMLFAGALGVELNALMEHRLMVLVLATVGVLLSTFFVGSLVWLATMAVGVDLPFIYALLFGALISPTDPVAVLAVLNRVHAPEDLRVLISGESLFNDGVGVVVFTAILGVLVSGTTSPGHVVELFAREALGGLAYGLVLGYVAYLLLKQVDQHTVEVMITLAVVTGGYALAMRLHTSGPLAMVVAGLLVGNRGRALAMSDTTRDHLDKFWIVVDETLNAMLFLIIGLEVVALDLHWQLIVAGLVAIPIVLAARFASVGIPIAFIRLRRAVKPYTVRILTWSGLRGGIAIALALSIPAATEREFVLAITYVVVVFSILVQGLTVERLARRRVARVVAADRWEVDPAVKTALLGGSGGEAQP